MGAAEGGGDTLLTRAGHRLASPAALLMLAVGGCLAILTLPVTVPVGPMYWDVIVYYDAANRIFSGQQPMLDFFAPVGPLGYYLFAGLAWLFPNAHPSLLAPWSLLLVTGPLMALLLHEVGNRSRGTALALLLPFLIFALLPFNTRDFHPLPGSEAFGIYNRQSCQLLYVLVAALMFVRDRGVMLALVALTMTTLFFLKVTGFAAGGIICAYALLTGRVSIRLAVCAGLVFAVMLAAVEAFTGMTSAYVEDIRLLFSMNSGSWLSRLRESASQNFDVVSISSVLIALLIWIAFHGWSERDRQTAARPTADRLRATLDQLPCWLAVVVAAGVLFEAQNTGSQAFIFMWPVLLAVLIDARGLIVRPALLLTVAGLSAAVALPPAVNVKESAARTYIGGLNNTVLAHRNLDTLGAVNMRPEVLHRADRMLKIYPRHGAFYADLIAADEYPAPLFYAASYFQVAYLRRVDQAIDSIRDLEARKGVRFQTIMSLEFVNPFPWLMKRQAPRHISIGADPFRTVPKPGPEARTAVADTDLVLYPKCPSTINSVKLYSIYAEALGEHRRIRLNDCYEALVHERFADELSG